MRKLIVLPTPSSGTTGTGKPLGLDHYGYFDNACRRIKGGDDRILFDQATGRLYYDADRTLNGALSAPAVLFAIVTNHAALTFQDFYVL